MERFEEKYTPEPNSGCWLWTAGVNKHGYGKFYVDGKTVGAHKFAYESKYGRVPTGLHLDHKCRVRSCCNPDHLEPVTCQENILRGAGLAAGNARKTHCVNGHPLEGDNIYTVTKAHGRRCKVCSREESLARYYRNKQ